MPRFSHPSLRSSAQTQRTPGTGGPAAAPWRCWPGRWSGWICWSHSRASATPRRARGRSLSPRTCWGCIPHWTGGWAGCSPGPRTWCTAWRGNRQWWTSLWPRPGRCTRCLSVRCGWWARCRASLGATPTLRSSQRAWAVSTGQICSPGKWEFLLWVENLNFYSIISPVRIQVYWYLLPGCHVVMSADILSWCNISQYQH